MIDADDVVRRLDRRDGFAVVSYREVGLPLFRLNCVMTLQETSAVGPIEEYTLRSIDKGVASVAKLEQFLGLSTRVIEGQLGQLIYDGKVVEDISVSGSYRLSAAGHSYLARAETSRIERQRLPVYFDGITREIVSVESSDVWTAADLDGVGLPCISPVRREFPKIVDIDISQVNRVMSSTLGARGLKRRAIRLDALVGRTNVLFQRALAIAFKSSDGKNICIAFAIDGRESYKHELEFHRSGIASKSVLFRDLFDASRRRREVQQVRRELSRVVDFDEARTGESGVLTLAGSSSKVRVRGENFRVLSVHDHPPLLRRALSSSIRRVLIVSPWIRAAVVDERFIESLIACLQRGVLVSVAYGIGSKDHQERNADKRAREKLEALMTRFPNFRIVRKGNTHAKVLLVDSDFFVTTSFNWLSFAGDPLKPMREEEGTMISDPQAVDAYYDRLVRSLNEAKDQK